MFRPEQPPGAWGLSCPSSRWGIALVHFIATLPPPCEGTQLDVWVSVKDPKLGIRHGRTDEDPLGSGLGGETPGEAQDPHVLMHHTSRCPSCSLSHVHVAVGGPAPACTHLNVPHTLPSPTRCAGERSWSPHAPLLLPVASACTPRKAGPRVQPARPQPHRPQRRPESGAPKEIPPEAVREYVDIMEGMLGLARPATRELDGGRKEDRNEPQQEGGGVYLDLGLLSYVDKLCSQEDFVTKVGWLGAWGSRRF